jgi:hypothetical protein
LQQQKKKDPTDYQAYPEWRKERTSGGEEKGAKEG